MNRSWRWWRYRLQQKQWRLGWGWRNWPTLWWFWSWYQRSQIAEELQIQALSISVCLGHGAFLVNRIPIMGVRKVFLELWPNQALRLLGEASNRLLDGELKPSDIQAIAGSVALAIRDLPWTSLQADFRSQLEAIKQKIEKLA